MRASLKWLLAFRPAHSFARLGARVKLLALLAIVAPLCALADDQRPVRIIAYGDSLAAGYGLGPEDGFTAQLQDWLAAQPDAPEVEILNASVAGDTAGDGLARLDWSLAGIEADAVILALGANNMLQGLPPEEMEADLRALMEGLVTERGLRPLIAGMRAPLNLGADYVAKFEAVFPELAQDYDALYYPFFLEGVAGVRALNQEDEIHPNKEGVALMVQSIGPLVLELAQGVEAAR